MLKTLNKGEIGRGYLIESEGFIFNDKQDIITESNQKQQIKFDLNNPYLYCVLQKYDEVNRNGRVYPEHILREAVKKYAFHVEGRSAIGSIDHEDDTNVSLRRDTVGLMIEEFYWEKKCLIGKIYLPISRAFKEIGSIHSGVDWIANLILHNIKVGISSRGIGEVKKQNGKSIVTDYDLICWDWVQMPSTYGSWAYANKEEVNQHLTNETKVKKKVKNKYQELMDLFK